MPESECLPPRSAVARPRFRVPEGAWDTHVHAIGAVDRFPLSPARGYTPAPAPIEHYVALMSQLGIARAVLVQPSIYGSDNRAMLDALARFPERFRGVAVVAPAITDGELRALHDAGVRGVRANLLNPGGLSWADALDLARRFARLGWHLQIQIDVSTFERFDDIARSPVDVVVDHMGYMPAGKGAAEPGFQRLLDLVAAGCCWVKLSGAYRMADWQRTGYDPVHPLARGLIAANPDRMLWASDWPHTDLRSGMPDDGDLLNLLDDWADDDATRDAILVRNPAMLYGR